MTDVICVDPRPGRMGVQIGKTDTGLRFMARYVVVGECEPALCAYCTEQCAKLKLAETPSPYGWCARRFVRPAPPRAETNIVHVSVALRRPEPISQTGAHLVERRTTMPYRYVGRCPLYQGRTALGTFSSTSSELLLVQFDEPLHAENSTPLHLGWHEFPAADWESIKEAA